MTANRNKLKDLSIQTTENQEINSKQYELEFMKCKMLVKKDKGPKENSEVAALKRKDSMLFRRIL